MDPLKGKVSPLKRLYYRWKALRNVPFRKKWFVGYDLDGNTFWEFTNLNYPGRLRRLVEYREKKPSYSDYKLPPQWLQWLRHTRPNYPTLEELLGDLRRQEILRMRVKAAEERWKQIPLKSEPGSGSPPSMADIMNSVKSGDAGVSGTPQSANSAGVLETPPPETSNSSEVLPGAAKPSTGEFQPQEWVKKPASRG